MSSPNESSRLQPTTVWVEPTSACNLKCSFCFHSNDSMGRPKGLMSEATYQRIVAEVAPFSPRLMLHHSGESFLHKQLFDFIRHARGAGLYVGMTTNGTLLDRDDFGILDTGIDHLSISLSGVDEADYRAIKVKDEYAQVRDNVMQLAAAKRRRGASTRLVVNVTQTAYNRGRIDAFRREYESIPGIDEVVVRRLMDWGGAVDVGHLEAGRTWRETLRGLKKSLVALVRDEPDQPVCNAPFEYAAVLWDGTIVPCCLDFDAALALGNIHDGAFLDTWNGPVMQDLRRMMRSVAATKRHPVCGPCKFGGAAKADQDAMAASDPAPVALTVSAAA